MPKELKKLREMPVGEIEKLQSEYSLKFARAFELDLELNEKQPQKRAFDFKESDVLYHRLSSEYVGAMIHKKNYGIGEVDFPPLLKFYYRNLPEEIRKILDE
jgi:hypothetical protein